MMKGIYKIKCLSNGKFYIGSTTHFNIRWKQHKRALGKTAGGFIWKYKKDCK